MAFGGISSCRGLRSSRIVLAALLTIAISVVAVPLAPPASAAEVYTMPQSGSWPVNGAGFGHGIGMSQWGTQGAALQGIPYDQILSFYYPGTSFGFIGSQKIRVQLTSYQGNAIVFGAYNGEQLVATDRADGSTH